MNKHGVKEKISPNSENLPFAEYCDKLKEVPKAPGEAFTPLENLFFAIAEATGKHHGSARRWYYGTAKPGLLEKKAVAELLECDVELLWSES